MKDEKPTPEMEEELKKDVLNTPNDPAPPERCPWCGTAHKYGVCQFYGL